MVELEKYKMCMIGIIYRVLFLQINKVILALHRRRDAIAISSDLCFDKK